MKILIQVSTHDKQIAFDMMGGSNSFSAGTTVDIPGNASLTASGIIGRKAFGLTETLEFVLTFGSGVTSGLVASWLYDKLKGKAASLRIERREVQIDNDEIKNILIEIIEKK